MAFLHGWAILAGVLGIGLPVFIHWLTRPRPIRMPLSTIRFVQEIIHQRRARNRLRDLLILALRTLAVALIALAFARPLIGRRPLVSDHNTGEAVRVVVLDVSASMGAVDHGMAILERARAVAAEHLRVRSGLRAGLVLAAAKARPVLDAPTANLAPLREELSRATPRPERLDAQAAIAIAAHLLAAETPSGIRRELVIVSDFQKSNWSKLDYAALPPDTQVQFESVAPATPPANLAVLRGTVRGRAQQGEDATIDVEIGNYSAASREVQVEVRVADAAATLRGLCPPRSRSLLTGRIALRQEGWQPGSIRLVGVEDALAEDNRLFIVPNVRRSPTCMLITREPGRAAPLSSYFLSRALDPSRPDEPRTGVQVFRNDPAQIDREQLNSAEFMLLDHPGPLSAENIRLLASLLRRGRSALYVCGEMADAANLKLLADAAPELRLPVEFFPTASPGTRGSRPRTNLRVEHFQKSEPPFSIFDEGVLSTIAALRFTAALGSRRSERGVSDEVLATYDDGSAMLVATSCGQGELAILNVDLAESRFPSSPLFVPLIHELVARLTSARRQIDRTGSGEPLMLHLPAEPESAGQLRVTRWHSDSPAPATDGMSAGGHEFGELIEDSNSILWRWDAAGVPGIYCVRHRDNVVFALATALPGEESDLDPAPPAQLESQASAGRRAHYRAAADQQPRDDDQWSWLAVACVLCMLGELGILRIFKT